MHEGIEGHGGHGDARDSLTTRISLSISILAVILAITTMLGHRAASEGSQKQAEAFDQWAYYQAKNGRQYTAQKTLELEGVMTALDKEKSEKLSDSLKKEIEKYEDDKREISDKAKELQRERDLMQKKVDKFEAGESFLEIALVLCSITLITRRSALWFIGLAIATGGIYFTIVGYLLH